MKIVIDLGHGVRNDRGAESKYIKEEIIINDVGSLVINKLKTLGHEVLEVRPVSANSVGDSLTQRVQKANSNNVDLYVSIHANAGGGKGTEIYTYRGKEVKEARNVLNNLVALGFTNRGIKGSNLFVIEQTNATAMLIEICFIDTPADVELYNKLGANNIADAIVKGLVETTTNATTGNSKPIQEDNRPKLSTHLRDWQQAYNQSYKANIYVDGIRGQQVEKAMKEAILKVGSNNSLVGWLQCRVGACIDNKYGNDTKTKVMEFQKANNLSVDGVVGFNTWDTLLKKYNW